jgi:uncharacterized damage-inducible protein DinB
VRKTVQSRESNLERLERLFRYDDWANRETLTSLERVGNAPAKPVAILAHIVGAGRLWHGRLTREERHASVWPRLTVAQCREGLDEINLLWRGYLAALTAEGLGENVSYVNSKGEPWTSAVEDILTHVVLHSAHHRGQIASALRAAGHAPAYTDYIHAVRQGFVK